MLLGAYAGLRCLYVESPPLSVLCGGSQDLDERLVYFFFGLVGLFWFLLLFVLFFWRVVGFVRAILRGVLVCCLRGHQDLGVSVLDFQLQVVEFLLSEAEEVVGWHVCVLAFVLLIDSGGRHGVRQHALLLNVRIRRALWESVLVLLDVGVDVVGFSAALEHFIKSERN